MSKVSYRSFVRANDIPASAPEAPLFQGDHLLETVDYWNAETPEGLGIVWHGSPWPITQRIWRSEPYWLYDGIKYPDSDGPVVCASASALVGAFYALGPRGQCTIGGNVHGGAEFGVKRQYKQNFLRAIGLVAGLPADNFTEFTDGIPDGLPNTDYIRLPELRCSEESVPQFVIKVSCGDFLNLLGADPASHLTYYE